jgi:hypothetical protein
MHDGFVTAKGEPTPKLIGELDELWRAWGLSAGAALPSHTFWTYLGPHPQTQDTVDAAISVLCRTMARQRPETRAELAAVANTWEAINSLPEPAPNASLRACADYIQDEQQAYMQYFFGGNTVISKEGLAAHLIDHDLYQPGSCVERLRHAKVLLGLAAPESAQTPQMPTELSNAQQLARTVTELAGAQDAVARMVAKSNDQSSEVQSEVHDDRKLGLAEMRALRTEWVKSINNRGFQNGYFQKPKMKSM